MTDAIAEWVRGRRAGAKHAPRPREAKERRLNFADFNVGGQTLETVDAATNEYDVVMVQEVARGEAGWHEYDTTHFHWLVWRHADKWRGQAVGVSHDIWDCFPQRAGAKHGLWVVCRLQDGGRLVIGNLHAPTGVTHQQYALAVEDFVTAHPVKRKGLPHVVGVDANEKLAWVGDEAGVADLNHGSHNRETLEEQFRRLLLRPLPPEPDHRNAPTHFPWDVTREGRQIDGVWVGWVVADGLSFRPEKRHIVNTDHALLQWRVKIGRGKRREWLTGGGARWVHDPERVAVADIRGVGDIIGLARTTTSRRGTHEYKDTDSVLEAIDRAHLLPHEPKLWKEVHKRRRRARRRWEQQRVARILEGDWGAYRARQMQRQRRAGWWGKLLEERTGEQLATDIKLHLEAKVWDPDLDWNKELRAMIDRVPCDVNNWRPFESTDVGRELEKMKRRAAAGPDGVGVDLLWHVHARGDGVLAEIANSVVRGEGGDDGWDHSLLALLPKIEHPGGPNDLRPIAVSSAMMKLVIRMTMHRCFPLLRVPSSVSACGKQRQAADLLGVMTRLRDMSREWRIPLLVAKLDVSGAFDNVRRMAVAEHLMQGLGEYPVELRFLLQQLGENVLEGMAPGGEKLVVHANKGIRQGSPESAEIFGMLMTLAVEDALEDARWPAFRGAMEDLPVAVVVYQDDVFLWDDDPHVLEQKIRIIAEKIARLGLSLSPTKTAVAASVAYEGRMMLDVMGQQVTVGNSIRALGVLFDFQGGSGGQAAEMLQRASNAAWAHDDLLRGQGSRAAKAAMVRSLVEGTFTWGAGALHWPQEQLQKANTVQLQVLRRAFRLGRKRGEDWMGWNARTLRDVRAWVAMAKVERWSAKVLRLQHQLLGHWQRQREGGELGLAARMLGWRSLRWWHAEQNLSFGMRHPGRFYPDNVERQVAETFGDDWPLLAQDRVGWAATLPRWLARWDARWCRGRQHSLPW